MHFNDCQMWFFLFFSFFQLWKSCDVRQNVSITIIIFGIMMDLSEVMCVWMRFQMNREVL